MMGEENHPHHAELSPIQVNDVATTRVPHRYRNRSGAEPCVHVVCVETSSISNPSW
jgi:hypothetical protein